MEQQHHDEKKKSGETSADYIPYPKINPEDIALPPPPPDQPNLEDGAKHPPPQSQSVDRSSELTREFPSTDAVPRTVLESNPYVSHSPDVSSSSSSIETIKGTAYTVRNVLSSWAKKVGEKTKAAEDLAGNVWQHLKTAPSLSEAAIGRIAHSTKVVAEGGNEKIFRQTFDTTPEEELINTYACYLSTSAGPVMGVLYLSTAKLAFCSDSPLSYKIGDNTEWSYYKVIIPLHQLKAVNPTASTVNRSEKYIQFISIDNHEFWFMGFMTYDNAVKSLQEAFQTRGSHSA